MYVRETRRAVSGRPVRLRQTGISISIDQLMEQASEALVSMDYFRAETAALRALAAARQLSDFERMARICMPLQEARRQKRQLALDAGVRMIIDAVPRRWNELRPGFYLVQVPLLGIDARTIRETADRRHIPMLVIAREPMTRLGKWPIVGVSGARETTPTPTGMVTVRTQVDPPAGAVLVEGSRTRDQGDNVPDQAWFLAAAEALGDAAIAKILPTDHPHHRVDELIEYLDAFPDHEKLHQLLESTCREAAGAELPAEPRQPKTPLRRSF